jgi:hypothetical protein
VGERKLTGGCQCGAVRYALSSQPTGASICHCRMCQKAFGNYFAPLAGVPRADLTWTRGQPSAFRSSEAVERGFCRDCGTPLYYRVLERDRISVSLGSLDDPAAVPPESQFGVESVVPFFATLHTLRVEAEDSDAALLARMASRQHPDHD